MAWIGCLRCKKFRRDFVARTFALIALVGPDLHRVLCSNEMVQMRPNHYKLHKNMSLGSNGMDRVPSLRKIPLDFVARTFALIALVRTILHWVSCSNEMVANATKHYETHKNMCLGCNGLDRVPSLRKIPTRLRSTNFCINCTSSARFESSFIRKHNGPNCTERVRNTPK